MSELPKQVMIWRSIPHLHHTGAWSTERYPDDAVAYVPKEASEPGQTASAQGDDAAPDPYKRSALAFCDILGEPELQFAWVPRKCFDGRWVWLRPVWARLCIPKPYLPGPSEAWWQYAMVTRAQP